MLSPSKPVLQKYKPLIVKMVKDSTIIVTTKANYEFLCNVKTLFGLVFYLYWKQYRSYPSLYKDARHSFVILWLLSSFVKQTYNKCIVNLTPCFPPKYFSLFLELFEHINDKLCLTWWKEPASQVEYATFFIGGKLYMFHVTNGTTCVVCLVSKEAWVETTNSMKKQCSSIIARLNIELENDF